MRSLRAADALSEFVIRVQDDDRPVDVQAIAIERQATHVAIFEGNRFRGIVALGEVAFSQSTRIFADLYDKFVAPSVVLPETLLDDLARIFEQERRDYVVVQDADGEYVGTITQQSLLRVLLEWTQEKSVEEKTSAEERFHALLEAAPDAMLIIDEDRRIALGNRNVEKLFGYNQAELNRLKIEALIPDNVCEILTAHFAPHVPKRVNDEIEQVFESMAWRKDGSEFPVEISFNLLTGSSQAYIVAALRDISIRKQSQAQLSLSLARFDSLSRVSPVGILFFDAAGKCVDANRRWCEMTGIQQADALGDGWHAAIHPEDRDRVVRKWTLMLQDGQFFHSEHRLRADEGRTTWVVCQVERVTNSLGEITGYVRTLSDVSRLKQTESALRLLSSDLAKLSGVAFYESIALHLAELLQCEITVVCQLDKEVPGRMVTLALCEDGAIQPNLSYSVAGTPCADVNDRGRCIIPRHVQQQYSDDSFLVDKRVDAYAGVALIDSSGRKLGHLAMMSRAPLRDPESVEDVLKLFSMSVVAEMERQHLTSRYSDLFEFSPDALVLTDRDGIIVQSNRRVAEVFGWQPAELVGQQVEVLIPTKLRGSHPSLRKGYHQSAVSRAMGSARSDLLGLRKDGSEFPIDVSLSPMHTPEGMLVAAAVRDVTERNHAQELIRSSEAKYRELFESSRDAVMIMSPLTGKFTTGNPATLCMFGVSDESELFRLKPGDLSPPQQPDGRPSGEKSAELVDQAVRDGTAFFAWTHRRINGEQFPATVLLTRMELAGQTMLQATVRDITDQVKNEQYLRKQANLAEFGSMVGMALAEKRDLRQVLHICAEAVVEYLDAVFARIWILNENEQVLELQASAGMYTHLDGPHARVPVGKYKIGLIALEKKPHLTNNVCTDPRVSDREWARREGLVAFAGYPLLVEERVVGVVAMFSHKTLGEATLDSLQTVSNAIAQHIDRKHAETELAQLNKTLEQKIAERTAELSAANENLIQASRFKSEFLATMSHELRTPLNGILGMTALLLKTELSAPQRQYAEASSSSGKLLAQLINDVLDLSKIEAGKLELDLHECDLESVVKDVADIMSHAIREKGLTLSCRVSPEACVVGPCDANRLQQVLVNLVGNAIKFTSSGSIAITVDRVAQLGRSVRLRFVVTDTGLGIPKERLSRLFKAFSQVDGSTTRQFGGTGLGLSICKQLIELMGGEIGVESQVGVGTEFWFEIEVITTEELTASKSGRQSLEETDLIQQLELKLSGHILVAEDNRINQLYIVELLEYFGCTSDLVVNGEEALTAIQQKPYDLVLMDCQMPEVDGFAATREIRKREAASQLPNRVPIVALTANALKGDRERCLAAGMDEYISKPVDGEQLRAVLEKYLNRTSEPPAAAGAGI